MAVLYDTLDCCIFDLFNIQLYKWIVNLSVNKSP
uniref:Uncharacterized protein n=1 Tax=Anguilla anguilla TaxID=7936 RepID=A0A0E9PLS1_ANGAN